MGIRAPSPHCPSVGAYSWRARCDVHSDTCCGRPPASRPRWPRCSMTTQSCTTPPCRSGAMLGGCVRCRCATASSPLGFATSAEPTRTDRAAGVLLPTSHPPSARSGVRRVLPTCPSRADSGIPTVQGSGLVRHRGVALGSGRLPVGLDRRRASAVPAERRAHSGPPAAGMSCSPATTFHLNPPMACTFPTLATSNAAPAGLPPRGGLSPGVGGAALGVRGHVLKSLDCTVRFAASGLTTRTRSRSTWYVGTT